MSSSKKIYILFAIIAIVVALVFYVTKVNVPKYHWTENLDYDNDQPYGLKLLHDLLANNRTKKDFVLVQGTPEEYLDTIDTNSLYIFIGERYIVDSVSSQAILRFVARGNNAFFSDISSQHDFFTTFTDSVHGLLTYRSLYDSLVRVSFFPINKDSTFKFGFKYEKKLKEHGWYGMDSIFFTDSLEMFGFEAISRIDSGYVDAFRVRYGKGWFVFHFNPILLTNYYMHTEDGFRYLNTLLSNYSKRKVYWDEFSKTSISDDYRQQHGSPLKFILSERSLRWSWYLLIFLVLLFVLFNYKRKQACVPLLPDNKNTTIEYINSIATIHYQNKSVNFLADEMMKQFTAFIRHKYGISPNTDKKEVIKVLPPKSGLPQERISAIYTHHFNVTYAPVFELKDVIELYKATEYFYKNCK